MCGGFTQNKPMDDEVKAIANEMKPKVETAMNKTFGVYEPVCYKTQVVAGVNYSIKVKVDGGKYLHMKIFKPLPCNGTELELLNQTDGHTLEDVL